MYPAFNMKNVFHPASPTDHPIYLSIGIAVQDVIGQMTSGKTCDPCDENFHLSS